MLYHVIAPCPSGADAEETGLFIDPDRFGKQMDDLARRGYHAVTLEQFAAAMEGIPPPVRSFLLTFDDAYAHIDAVVSPVLRRHGFTAAVFASSAHLGGMNTWDYGHPNLAELQIATEDQLAHMSGGPWEIASHGHRHVDLRCLDAGARRAELMESRERLSRLTRRSVVDLAYPYGFDDEAVRADVRVAGYRRAFTMAHTNNTNPWHLARRPIRGTDSLAVFRLKASGWSDNLYRMGSVAPGWARGAARALLGAGVL